MEVLIRFLCQCQLPPKEAFFNTQCPSCNGKGHLERWVPHFLLCDIHRLIKNAYIIRGRRHIPDYSLATSTARHPLHQDSR